jgi:hypothetical protein
VTDTPHRKRKRGWIIAAMLAVILLLGEVAIEVLSNDLQELLHPYRKYVWTVLGLALIATIIMAFRESRASDDPSEDGRLGDRNISAGEVKNSTLVTATG